LPHHTRPQLPRNSSLIRDAAGAKAGPGKTAIDSIWRPGLGSRQWRWTGAKCLIGRRQNRIFGGIQMKRQILGAMAVSVMALCFSFAAEAKTTLVYCSEASPEGFSPQLWDTGTTLDAVRPVYNRLVEFKFGTTEVMPSLAESWEISDDGLSYTFHLRKDVKFHSSKTFKPSRGLTADD